MQQRFAAILEPHIFTVNLCVRVPKWQVDALDVIACPRKQVNRLEHNDGNYQSKKSRLKTSVLP